MRVSAAIRMIHEILGDRVSIDEITTICFKMFSDKEYYDSSDPLHPISPMSSLHDNKSLLKDFSRLIHLSNSTCVRCPIRVEERTKVVVGDGDFDAELFIVQGSPSELDDKTGYPMSGAPENGLAQLVGAVPNSPLNDALAKKDFVEDVSDYYSTRNNWNDFVDLAGFGEEWKAKSKVYVTSEIKCRGNCADAEMLCFPWLEVERRLCSAKTTLIIGETKLANKLINYPYLKGEVLQPSGDYEYWGNVIIVEDNKEDIQRVIQSVFS